MNRPFALLVVFFSLGFLMTSCSSPSQTPPPGNSTDGSNKSATPSTSTACPTPSPDAARKIVITAPCNNAQVAARDFVEGLVSEANAQVVVIVHPMEGADYWVQPSVTVREGGRWKVLGYFGEAGPQHSGKHFEVMALNNPKERLAEGQMLANWPETPSKSQVIEVVRQ